MPDQAKAPSSDYWNEFYREDSDAVPVHPSSFATWAHGLFPLGVGVVELGFGTGRDSFFFTGKGHSVWGFDFSEAAVERASRLAQGVEARFQLLDLTVSSSVQEVRRAIGERQVVVYARFLIHALPLSGRDTMFDIAKDLRAPLFLEFRTGMDEQTEHYFGDDHYREYLNVAAVKKSICCRGGRVTHEEQGRGLAVHKHEDPHIGRLVADWPCT